MKKLILLLFLSIFLLSLVYACEYRINETNNQEGYYFIRNGQYLDYPILEIKNFQQSSRNGDRYITYSTSPTRFDVYNNYNEEINFTIIFIMDGEEKRVNLDIDSKGFKSLQYDYPNNIDNSTIKFDINSPSDLKYELDNRIFLEEVCKMCGNEICLDDGASCNPLYDDSKCGSGICNIVGFCGHTKVVDCPDGKLNCNDKICLEPSTKDFNEGYMCEFECKYGGKEGKCIENPVLIKERKDKTKRNWILFGTLIIVLSSAGIWLFAKHKTGEEIKKRDQIIVELNHLRKEKEELIDSTKKSKIEIDGLKEERNGKEREIKNLEEKIRRSKGEIKKRYEKELARLKQQNKMIEDNLRSKRNDLTIQEKKLLEKEKELAIRNEEYWRKKALEDSNQKENLTLNEKGYLVFKNNRNNLYHVWKYRDYLNKKGEKIPRDVSIHHIDGNKLNNALWNLTPLNKKIHDIEYGESLNGKFNHNSIEPYNWESGIIQIKEQLVWKDSDFPEHIQQEIKRRKERRKSE